MLRADLKPRATHQPRLPWHHYAIHIISPSVLTFALFLALIFAVVIPAMKRNIVERKKETIRELTQVAWNELAGLHEQERLGLLTREAAQQVARARIQRMRYGADGKDYFWISDTAPRMIMHPYRPEMDGQDLSGYSDPAGRNLFAEAAALVRRSGAGYIEYLWQWKDDARRVEPKLSYVKGFDPWGWNRRSRRGPRGAGRLGNPPCPAPRPGVAVERGQGRPIRARAAGEPRPGAVLR